MEYPLLQGSHLVEQGLLAAVVFEQPLVELAGPV